MGWRARRQLGTPAASLAEQRWGCAHLSVREHRVFASNGDRMVHGRAGRHIDAHS